MHGNVFTNQRTTGSEPTDVVSHWFKYVDRIPSCAWPLFYLVVSGDVIDDGTDLFR